MSDAKCLSQHVSSALTQDQGHDELLRDACEGLWAHLEVLEWCVQQSRYVPAKPFPSLPYLGLIQSCAPFLEKKKIVLLTRQEYLLMWGKHK